MPNTRQVYPMAVVSTAGRGIIVYQLEGQPQEYKKIESPLKYQVRLASYQMARVLTLNS